MKTLYESILSSTKTGKSGIKEKISEWAKENKFKDFEIDDNNYLSIHDLPIGLNGSGFEIKTDIPSYIKIKEITVLKVNRQDVIDIIPEKSKKLIFEGVIIKDFSFLDGKICEIIEIHNCDIKSLKGLDKVEKLFSINVSGNKYVYRNKELIKASGLKASNVRNLGFYYRMYNSYCVSAYDETQIDNQLYNITKKIKKEIPEIKFSTTDVRRNSSSIYFSFDFLERDKIPHKIRMNGIYLAFKFDIDESKLSLHSNGHIEITPEEKQTSKYKYFALKSLLDPYYDNGGKKFRKTSIKEFYSDEIADKLIPFIKDVIAAALENQGGKLERK